MRLNVANNYLCLIQTENSAANAAKKAAKKAEAKAKKAAMKAGGGAPAGGAKGAPAAKPAAAPKFVPGRPPATKSTLRPLQISFNPNAPLSDRPVVALTTAVLLDSIVDYELVSDHTRPGVHLGLPSGNGEIGGDLAIARFIAKREKEDGAKFMGGGSDEDAALMDQWVDYASSLAKFGLARRCLAVQRTLDPLLVGGTFVVGTSVTLADVALFAAMGFPSSDVAKAEVAAILPSGCPTLRWVEAISHHPAVREATQLAVGVSQKEEANVESGAEIDPLVSGMSFLEGGLPGQVCTRFPPNPVVICTWDTPRPSCSMIIMPADTREG